ncbi:HlyD family secretion protein [Pedobacter sp. KLB.chiD]|uniref:HlyD family secretion protein n=1 Tax=Pedobacter sp. KLB.chiD TaxID=3387402 RepID=UPI00399949DB
MAEKSTQRKGGKNHRKLVLINSIIFILVSVALIWSLLRYLHIGEQTYTNDAQIESFINPVNTRVSAYIKEIRFIEHQKVKRGDTLVILDNREIATQVQQAEAAYLNALAGKNVSSATVNTISNNMAVMESNIAAAKARLWNAEENYNRYKTLLKDEAVTRQQYDQVKTEYDAQNAQYQSLLRQRKTAGLSVVEASSRIKSNEAEIKRTAAALEMAKLNLSYTVITAANDGVLGRRTINEGQLLQAGQQIATLVTDDKKWVVANFREKQMHAVKIGSKVKVTVDALDGKAYEGKITAISEATGAKYSSIPVDNSTGNFVKVQQRIPVRIEFTKNNSTEAVKQLRAGMNVEIKII